MRGTENITTASLTAAMHCSKLSDRKVTFVPVKTVHSLGHSISNLNIIRSSMKRHREKCRVQHAAAFFFFLESAIAAVARCQAIVSDEASSAALKSDFAGDVLLLLHWDGKLMAGLSGKDRVDHLPIITSERGVSQLLKVSKLSGATGENQSSVVQRGGVVSAELCG